LYFYCLHGKGFATIVGCPSLYSFLQELLRERPTTIRHAALCKDKRLLIGIVDAIVHIILLLLHQRFAWANTTCWADLVLEYLLASISMQSPSEEVLILEPVRCGVAFMVVDRHAVFIAVEGWRAKGSLATVRGEH